MKNLFTKTQTRRTFLKAAGVSGIACAIPSVLLADLFKDSYADFGEFLLRVMHEPYDNEIGVLMPEQFSDKFAGVITHPDMLSRLKREKLIGMCYIMNDLGKDKEALAKIVLQGFQRELEFRQYPDTENSIAALWFDDNTKKVNSTAAKPKVYPKPINPPKITIRTWFYVDDDLTKPGWACKENDPDGTFRFTVRAV